MEQRITALARESGLPAQGIRDLLPADFAGAAPGEERMADAMLELHRHLVRIDPRVSGAGGNMMSFERGDDLRRLQALEVRMNEAAAAMNRGREKKLAGDAAAIVRVFEGRVRHFPDE
jgi:hypothetical protein